MKKRINKSKEQIRDDMQNVERMKREKALFKKVWPFIQEGLTIYDAQTVLGAVSGYIQLAIESEVAKMKVGDLIIDVSKEKDCPVKASLQKVLEELKNEDAKEVAQLLEKFGRVFSMYAAHEYMKKDIKELKVDDLVA